MSGSVPFFEEHTRALRKLLCGVANLFQSALEVRSERPSLRLAADEAGEHTNHLEDLGNRALVERENRKSALDQL